MSIGGSAPEGSSGYIYSFGIHMGIGRGPVDSVIAAKVGGKLAWTGNMTASGDAYIDQPMLFGGPKKEGGIQGFFRVLMGEASQVASDALRALCAPVPSPGFRGTLTIHYDGQVSALNPYPKPWSWRVRRAVQGWDGSPIRPDLAVIPLVGQIVDPGTPKPPTELAMGGGMAEVPLAHGAKAHVVSSVFGFPNVTGIGQVVNSDTGLPIFPFTFVINGDGTADVTVPAKFFTKNLIITYYTQTGVGGFPTGPTGINTFNADRMDNPIYVDYILPAGATSVSFLEFGITDGGSTDGLTLVGPPTLQPDGVSMRIFYSPSFYLRPVRARFGYFVGGVPASPYQVYSQGEINQPAVVEIAAPPSTKYFATWRVTSTMNTNSNPTDFVAVDYPYSEEGLGATPNIGRVGIKSIEAEGTTVAVNIYYDPNNNTSGLEYDPNIKAMNPSHIIYECLTNRPWGRGLDRGVINLASFEAAAQTLFNEGFGLCLRWNRRDSIDSFVQSVLDHIGATLFTDRSTALLTLKLIRGDYVKSSLKLWDTSNGILSIEDSAVNSSTMVINEIKIVWHDPIYDEDRTVNEQNLASLISSNGAFNTMTKSYTGLPTAGLARRVALRDLKAQAEGLRKFKVKLDRRGWNVTPGEVFRMQDGPRQIPDMVVRVARVEDGTLTNGTITCDVAQDVFSFPAASFTDEQPNTWTPPNHTPCVGDHEAFELPYFMVARGLTAAEFAQVTPTSAYMGVIAELGQPANVNYDIAVRDTAPTVEDNPLPADQLYCGYIA